MATKLKIDNENAVVVFGDDGEKFGTWPDTKQHVYEHGWLRRFFDLLTENKDWLWTTTLADALDNTSPAGTALAGTADASFFCAT